MSGSCLLTTKSLEKSRQDFGNSTWFFEAAFLFQPGNGVTELGASPRRQMLTDTWW